MLSKITKNQFAKIVVAALYVSVSAGLAYIISLTTNDPDLFGPLTPIINIALVTIKQAFTTEK